MATKKSATPSMADVTSSDKVTPPASGRPIIVSNHSVLPNDPMVVNDEDKDSPGAAPASAPIINRQAKTIIPISHEVAPESESTKEPSAPAEPNAIADSAEEGTDSTPQSEAADKSKKTAGVKTIEPASEKSEEDSETEGVATDEKAATEPSEDEPVEETTDPENEAAAKGNSPDADKKLAAAEARERELESLIESGKYAVPINVEHHHRSVLSWLLWVLVVLLVVVLALDLLLDAGLLSLPVQVPHTHFLGASKP